MSKEVRGQSTAKGTQVLLSSQGKVHTLSVEQGTNQSGKKWYTFSLVIGSLSLIIIGGLGTIGLLHSYNAITLDPGFASTIRNISSTAPFTGLWTMAICGVLFGGGMTILSVYKLINLGNKHFKPSAPIETQEQNPTKTKPPPIKPTLLKEAVKEIDAKKININIGQEFQSLDIDIEDPFVKKTESFFEKKYQYRITPHQQPYEIVTIKDLNGNNMSILVRQSKSREGYYHWIQPSLTNQKRESSQVFTLAQLSSMMRLANDPPKEYRISGLTELVRAQTGVIIFSKPSELNKKYYIVDSKGNLRQAFLEEWFILRNDLHKQKKLSQA